VNQASEEIQVRLADVLVRLERAEFALRQLRTNFANGFPLGGNFGSFTNRQSAN
jgi:hypothetical protein